MKVIGTIAIDPSTNLLDALASNYDFNSAIADLIDNCIDGGASEIKLFFASSGKSFDFHLFDNGSGMSFDELRKAAILGEKGIEDFRNSDALGRYSSGLKAASKYLATELLVTSKKENLESNTIKIDFIKLKETKQWVADIVEKFKTPFDIGQHGTIVSCCNLRRIESKNDLILKIEKLKTHLNHVFGRYIIEDGLKISIQTETSREFVLEGWDPFFLPTNKGTKKVYDSPIKYKGVKIPTAIFILPSFESLVPTDQAYMGGGNGKNLNLLQGFYIYRNKRLISEGGWQLPELDINDKTRYARVRIDLPSSFDEEFNISLAKSKLEIPTDLYPQLRNVAKKARSESNKNYNYKKMPESKPQLNKKQDTIWISVRTSNGTALKLNKNNVVLKDLCKKLSDHEYEKLLNLISKAFPYSMASTQIIDQESYTQNEIQNLAKDLYLSLLDAGFKKEDIHKKIIETEPFNHYINDVMNLFLEMESLNDSRTAK